MPQLTAWSFTASIRTPLDDIRDPGTPHRIRKIRHSAVRFEGDAVITDVGAVRSAVLSGIGRGKSFGCGLLSLALVET